MQFALVSLTALATSSPWIGGWVENVPGTGSATIALRCIAGVDCASIMSAVRSPSTALWQSPQNATVSSDAIALFGLSGKLSSGVITWSNGLAWDSARVVARKLAAATTCSDRRPPLRARTFRSVVVDAAVEATAAALEAKGSPTLACIFRNTAANTLDTTIARFTPASTTSGGGGPDSFVITGDIAAMWLRDSCNQLLPFLPFVEHDAALLELLAGAVRRQAAQVAADPYANAHTYNGRSPDHTDDATTTCTFGPSRSDAMVDGIFERKYELDSLCAFFKLSRSLWGAIRDGAIPPPAAWAATLFDGTWFTAVERALEVIITMQRSSSEEAAAPGGATYQFQRNTAQPTDTLLHAVGSPAARTGMSRSSFRPSDDATTLPFLVPSNAMAVVELTALAEMLTELLKGSSPSSSPSSSSSSQQQQERSLGGSSAAAASWSGNIPNATAVQAAATRAAALAAEIDAAIAAHAIVESRSKSPSPVYAYEVDGFGNALLMDDANVPSLLSLPLLGYRNASDATYAATRANVLSTETNPWFFRGSQCPAGGVGGPHVGLGAVWPMAIIVQALTSVDDLEIALCVDQLVASSAGTGLMHESFSAESVGSYSRPWFAWANSLFGELVFKLEKTRPHLLQGLR